MFTTIILGAGKSTRMKANKSKLLFDIAGKPIIEHIVDSVQKCKSKNIICVVNKESHELVKLLKSKKVDVAYQKNINGTAGAAESALSLLKTKNSPVLILCGDAPFISSRSIRAITKEAAKRNLKVHLHLEEQQKEIDDCLEAHGMRPLDLLLNTVPQDQLQSER